MQNTINKKQNIKLIPTPHNYFKRIDTAFKRLRTQGNISRLLIIAIIIWNLILTCCLLQPKTNINIPEFTEEQNLQVMQLEEIPF